MATFTQRPNGWLARVRKAGYAPRTATFKTKAQAKAWAAQVEADISTGKAGGIVDKPFSALIERYLESHVPLLDGERSETLRLNRVLKEPIAKVRLPDLGPEHVAAWRDSRLKKVSGESVRREWSSLAHACTIAIKEWRWLRTNPFTSVKKPEKAQPRDRRPTDNEIDRLLLACGYDGSSNLSTAQSRVGSAILFAIETAMRAGEICALRSEDVDIDRRIVRVTAAVRGARKTMKGRVVPLSDEAIRVLQQLPKGMNTIFGLTPAILDALFRKAKGRAMVEGLHFHDFRREALTRMVAKGVEVMTLAKISGHADLRILQSVYYAPDMSEVRL